MTRIGVLRGGNPSGFEQSIKAGNAALKHLRDTYATQDIYVDKNGAWHIQGVQVLPHEAVQNIDVLFNAMGTFDRGVHHFLDYHNVPYNGSRSVELSVLTNRLLAKKALIAHEIKTPFHKEISPGTDPYVLFRSFPLPAVAKFYTKPDVVYIKSIEDLIKILQTPERFILEEFIPGIKVSVHIIEQYRDHDIYVLPPVEVYDSKHVVPSNLLHSVKESLMNLAKKAHEFLSLKHHSQHDFIVHPKRGIYLIRVNSLPDITDDSSFAKALESVGSNMQHFLVHTINLALQKG